jgi:GntR family transcriptional regulator
MGTSRRESASSVATNQLRQAITGGTFAPGEQLPSEPRLAEILGTSRASLREALRSLSDEGLIIRRHGVGTFVTRISATVETSLHLNFGVSRLIELFGKVPGTRHLLARHERGSAEVRLRLQLGPHEGVLALQRLRTADGRPAVHSTDFIPDRFAPSAPDELGGSIYRYLEDVQRQVVDHGVATLAPTIASGALATALEVEPGELLMTVHQLDVRADGVPVLYGIEHYVARMFTFSVLRRGPGSQADRLATRMAG